MTLEFVPHHVYVKLTPHQIHILLEALDALHEAIFYENRATDDEEIRTANEERRKAAEELTKSIVSQYMRYQYNQTEADHA